LFTCRIKLQIILESHTYAPYFASVAEIEPIEVSEN